LGHSWDTRAQQPPTTGNNRQQLERREPFDDAAVWLFRVVASQSTALARQPLTTFDQVVPSVETMISSAGRSYAGDPSEVASRRFSIPRPRGVFVKDLSHA
jgi:hypothetical protein